MFRFLWRKLLRRRGAETQAQDQMPAVAVEAEPVLQPETECACQAEISADAAVNVSRETIPAVGPISPLPCRAIAVVNQKGGVGKTTTAVNLAAALAGTGRRVLLVDVDPQGNAGSGLGVDKEKLSYCLYDLLAGSVDFQTLRLETVVEGLHLLPATVNLAGAEVEMVYLQNRERCLGDALRPWVDEYDCLLMDCPPSLGVLTVNALCAASEVLVPVQCEYFALEGLRRLYATLDLINGGINPFLEGRSILISMFDSRIRLHRQVRQMIESEFGGDVRKTVVPRSVRLSEAPGLGRPISACEDPRDLGGVYRLLAEEVLNLDS